MLHMKMLQKTTCYEIQNQIFRVFKRNTYFIEFVIAIKLNNLSKFYYENPSLRHYLLHKVFTKYKSRKIFVLKNINLIIPKGNVVGIIGDNGAGKSTLLQIISGVMKPSSGSIQVNGKISALLELGSGFNPRFQWD